MDTAAEILGLGARDARRVFGADRKSIAARFRELAMRWHPDRNPDPAAKDAFARLSDLHRTALRIADAAGGAETSRTFRLRSGGSVSVGASRTRVVDHGEVLVGRGTVATLVRPDLADLADAARRFEPRFPDARARTEMERFLPRLEATHDTVEGTLFVHARTADQAPLRDLHAFLGGVEERHVAWMVSAMENIACWLEWSGTVHGDIGPDTLLVSPEFHSLALTGPSLFATPVGSRPAALPARTLDAVPRMASAGTAADHRIDLELVRLTAREMLQPADPSKGRPAAAAPFEAWLASPPQASPVRDYAGWQAARDAAFGPPRFIPLDVDMDVVNAA